MVQGKSLSIQKPDMAEFRILVVSKTTGKGLVQNVRVYKLWKMSLVLSGSAVIPGEVCQVSDEQRQRNGMGFGVKQSEFNA